jgi:hypothetical protein
MSRAAVFAEPPERYSFPRAEEETLAYWKKIDAFQESLRRSEGRKLWSFYDGPPFATGLPHYGHILAGTIKDIVCRYAHQTGHHVERRAGWDCHGLPVEFEIDQKLGIRGREDVLEMGIGKYNEECRAIVMRYSQEWVTTVTRMGRWIDFDNDYKTMNVSFMVRAASPPPPARAERRGARTGARVGSASLPPAPLAPPPAGDFARACAPAAHRRFPCAPALAAMPSGALRSRCGGCSSRCLTRGWCTRASR